MTNWCLSSHTTSMSCRTTEKIMAIHPKVFPKNTPTHPAIDHENTTTALSEEDLTKYRSVVKNCFVFGSGFATLHCQHCIRFQTTKMTSATQHCWQVLKHFVFIYLTARPLTLKLLSKRTFLTRGECIAGQSQALGWFE